MLRLVKTFHYKELWRNKYRFELLKNVSVVSNSLLAGIEFKHEYFCVRHGRAEAYLGYRWDGCTGVPDPESTIRASLFHDVMYQAFELGLIKRNFSNRRKADKLFLQIMKADGANWILRTTYFLGVRGFGGFFAYF